MAVTGLKIAFFLTIEAAGYAALLFGGAGTLRWPAGWAYFLLFFGGVIWMTGLLMRHDPALLAERTKSPFQKGQPGWDKIVLAVGLVALLAWTLLMPLDAVRFHWSQMPVGLQFAGGIGMVLAFWLMCRVSLENTYMSTAVRIQHERGHRVISTGPYAVVRHPLYLAVLIYLPSVALLLGSWYGMAGAVPIAAGLIFRTVMEDRELQRNLPGYTQYAVRVPYRLIRGVW